MKNLFSFLFYAFSILSFGQEIQFEKTAACNNDGTIEVIASFGKLPYKHSWKDDPDNTNSTRSNLKDGFYEVTVTDANFCKVSASTASGS